MSPAAEIFRIQMAQIAPALGDVERNRDLHLQCMAEARAAGARLVVFPELSLTGYWLQDLVPDVALNLETAAVLEPLRQASREIDVVFGLVEAGEDGRQYNSAVWFSEGRLIGRQRKVHLPTYTLFDEGRYFAAGTTVRTFVSPFGRTGLLVCEDLWHPALAYVLAQDGSDLLVVLSSSPGRGIETGDGQLASQHAWHLLGESAARFHTQFVVFVGRVGTEDGHTFGGGSFVYGPDGRQLAACPLLDEAAVIVDLDRRDLQRARTVSPLRRDDRPDLIRRELGRILDQRTGLAATDAESARQEK